jgi:hypothetical protein
LTAQTGSLVFATETANPMIFVTNATEAARIDSSGNLGLGVTPSTWLSAYRSFQFGSYGAAYSTTNSTVRSGFATNAYINTSNSFTYGSNGVALAYIQDSGGHQWLTAGSGTAGNAITFTQAMTLDASGNLGVGVTTQSERLRLGSATAGQARMAIEYNGSVISYLGSYSGIVGSGNATDMLIGAANVLAFASGGAGTERARIDSSGNLLVGTTTYRGRVTSEDAGSNSSNSPMGVNVTSASGSGACYVLTSYRLGTLVGSITNTSTATAYNTSSDYRLKENIAPMTGALATVAKLKPCTYSWKSTGEAGQGFIAHELQEVVPDCVTGEKDAVDADGNPKYQGIDTSFLVATLTAAIQELNAKFEAYKASHP